MSDATTSSVNAPSPLAPSRSVNGSSLLGKRRTRHEQSSVKPTAGTSRTTPDFSPGDVPSPLTSPTHTSTPDTLPSKRLNLSLNHPIDNTMPEPSSSTSATTTHCPEPASPAATEIAYDISYVEPSPEDHMETLRAAGIKVRDFAYEPMPNSSKAPEVFDPVPSLIAADWHMRNPEKNYGLLSPKGLFRLIKMGWLTVTDVRLNLHPREYAALAQYNDRPDEQRYPFVVIPPGQPIPTPSQRVRLRRQAGLNSHPDDVPDSEFFGYDPTGFSDDEGEEEGGPSSRLRRLPTTPSTSAETAASTSASGVVTEEAEVVVEEPKPKRRKVKGTAKARSRAKPKPLRRECSRPEV
jgi:hypothetical protein